MVLFRSEQRKERGDWEETESQAEREETAHREVAGETWKYLGEGVESNNNKNEAFFFKVRWKGWRLGIPSSLFVSSRA